MKDQKSAIRQRILQHRRTLSAHAVEEAGCAVAVAVSSLADFRSTPIVLAYAAIGNEIPTMPVIEAAWRAGKRVYLPACEGPDPAFRLFEATGALRPGPHGFSEASGEAFDFDGSGPVIVLAPLVAWDEAGGRLGRGGGFYDRTLWRLGNRAIAVGLGYEFQNCAPVPMDERDAPLHFVVSERRIVRCGTDVRSVRNRKDGSDGLLRGTPQPVPGHHSRLGA